MKNEKRKRFNYFWKSANLVIFVLPTTSAFQQYLINVAHHQMLHRGVTLYLMLLQVCRYV
jgi:hypothetical protein